MEKKKSLHRLRSPPLLSRKSQTLTSSTISHRCLRRRRLLWRRPSSTSCSTRMTAAYPPAPRTASGSTTATPSVRSSAATSTARRRDRRRGDALPLQHPGARWRRGEPQYPPNKLMIWDDHQSRCIGELSFQLEVQAVQLRRDRIVVVLEQRVFVYNFADLKLMQQIETVPPWKGLCAVSQAAATFVLVCPVTQKGQVRVENYSSKRTKFIAAHDSRVACFALTPDGRLLATASSKGTVVRIFNTCDGALL